MRPRHALALLAPLLALAVVLPAAATPSTPSRLEKTLVLGKWQVTADSQPLATSPPSAPPPAPGWLNRQGDPEVWLRLAFALSNGEDFDIARAVRTEFPGGGVAYSTAPVVKGRGNDISPRISPDVGTILFSSDRGGDYDLFRVPYEGGEPTLSVGGLGDQVNGAWSPDGRRIVYSSSHEGNYEIYTSAPDGSGPARLTSDGATDGQPSWSPDGLTIIWARWSGATGVVWAMDADGRNQRALTGPLLFLGTPVWSPDGSQIALDFDADGDGYNRPAVMSANGSGLRTLAIFPENDGFKWNVTVNAWSPDGQRVFAEAARYYVGWGEPLLQEVFIGRVPLTEADLVRTTSNRGALYPDARSIDQQAPVSTLSPLPFYTRSGPLVVTLSGGDDGLAPVRGFEVQVRRNGGAWATLSSGELSSPWHTFSQTFTYSEGRPGDVIELRGRAIDDAGNREPFPAQSEATTTLFAAELSGQITDNRGYPTLASFTLNPAAIKPGESDPKGHYLIRTTTAGAQAITPTAPGLKAPPATTLTMTRDQYFSAAMLPADDLLGDGSFETASLGGWSTTGSLPAPQAVSRSFTGAKGLRVGTTCAEPCLSELMAVPTTPPGRAFQGVLAVAEDGLEHLVFRTTQFNYATRTMGGQWSPPEEIPDLGTPAYGTPVDAIVDPDGALHIIYGGSTQLFYTTRSPSGVWSEPTSLGPADLNAQLFRGTDGRLIVVGTCLSDCLVASRVFVRVLRPGSAWSAPQPLTTAGAFTGALGPDGAIYLAWRGDDAIRVTTVDADGRQTGEYPIMPISYLMVEYSGIAIDAQGAIHVMWGGRDGGAYVFCATIQRCSAPQAMPQINWPGSTSFIEAIVDKQGVTHMLSGSVYWKRLADGTFTTPINTMPNALGTPFDLRKDGNDNLHIFYGGITRTTAFSPAAGVHTLTRQVTIPATMHRPTLSFAYSLGRVAAGSGLQVLVDDGSGPEAVLTRSTPSPWGFFWADLTPYAGKTVTLTLTLSQGANVAPVELLLDDIALGSWSTPVLESASPLVLSAVQPTTLTITGTNFLAGGQVLLGTTQVTGIERVDETTLRVSVPAGMKPGLYRLSVVNPDGARAVLDGVVVGERRLAPMVVR